MNKSNPNQKKLLFICLQFGDVPPRFLSVVRSDPVRDKNGKTTWIHKCSQVFRNTVLEESGCSDFEAILGGEFAAQEAINCLRSGEIDTAVVCDSTIMRANAHPVVKDLAIELRHFTQDGGRTIFTFSCAANLGELDLSIFFGDIWRLPWTAAGFTEEKITVTDPDRACQKLVCDPFGKCPTTIDNHAHWHLCHVKTKSLIYVCDGMEGTDGIGPVVFEAYGRGYIGYVGDAGYEDYIVPCDEHDRELGRLVGAMCSDHVLSGDCGCYSPEGCAMTPSPLLTPTLGHEDDDEDRGQDRD